MTSKAFWAVGALALAGAGSVVIASSVTAPPAETNVAAAAAPRSAAAEPGVIQVWKSPTCGCCTGWVEHLRAAGFEVEVRESSDMAAVKARHGITDDLASCHTALVEGYLVEGHVPAADIRRLLAERPDVAGIAAPGMPMGSPGMEMPGRPADAYAVIAFTEDGGRSVFARH